MSSVTFQLDDPKATDEPAVWITLTENMDGSLTITAEVQDQDQQTGDLRGLFFDVTNEELISKLVFTSTSDMTTETGDDNITAVGSPSNNMNGRTLERGGFDVGIEIGSEGIGDDDIQTFSVTLSTSDNTNLTLADFALAEFGVRITSVGTGENRDGSNKLIGSVPAPLVGGPPPILLTQALSNLVLYLENGDGEVFKVKLEAAAGEEIYTISRAALQESISEQYGSDTEWLGLSIHAGNEYKNDAKWDGTANGEGVFFLLGDTTPIRAVGTKAGKGWTYDWSVDDFDNMSNAPSAKALAEGITAALLQQQATVTFSASDWM